jgi:hypothetical protein
LIVSFDKDKIDEKFVKDKFYVLCVGKKNHVDQNCISLSLMTNISKGICKKYEKG